MIQIEHCYDVLEKADRNTAKGSVSGSLRLFSSLLSLLVSVGVGANASEKDGIFSNKVVFRLQIEIASNDVVTLKTDPRREVPANVLEGSNIWRGVRIHLKGGVGSFRPIDDKPSFTLKFDYAQTDQRFHGLTKLHLNNSIQDGSYMTENLCSEMYRKSGVPSPRVSYATVEVNGQKRGLYVLKEGFTQDFLGGYFTNRNGNLYDGGFMREITDELERDLGKGDVKAWSDLKALASAAREKDAEKRFERLSRVLDLDRFFSFLSLQMITWDWDGYMMNRNNYRVYHDLDRDKMVFFPHGMDQMFWEVDHPILPPENKLNGLVARSVMKTPQGEKLYRERFEQIFTNAFQIDHLMARVDELAALITPHAEPDYTNQVRRLRILIKAQHANFERQLQATKSSH